MVADRVSGTKQEVSLLGLEHSIKEMLIKVQHELFAQAQAHQKSLMHEGVKLATFSAALAENNGVYKVGWCGNPACEAQLKQHQAAIRCIVEGNAKTECFACDQKSVHDIMIAKSY
jgi:prolyl-tRNA synthetase